MQSTLSAIARTALSGQKNAMSEGRKYYSYRLVTYNSCPITYANVAEIQEQCPDIKFEIVPFENTPENAKEILANLGKNIDIIGGIFDDTMLKLRKCEGLQLSREPFCCAMSIHHRLAQKVSFKSADLYGENLLLMRRGWSNYVDRLRNDIWQNHTQIHIVTLIFTV